MELKPEEYGKWASTTAVGKFEKMAIAPVTPFSEVATTSTPTWLLRRAVRSGARPSSHELSTWAKSRHITEHDDVTSCQDGITSSCMGVHFASSILVTSTVRPDRPVPARHARPMSFWRSGVEVATGRRIHMTIMSPSQLLDTLPKRDLTPEMGTITP